MNNATRRFGQQRASGSLGTGDIVGASTASASESGWCYAGIGSRDAPQEALDEMSELAAELEERGWHLSTGAANGADSAFENGVNNAALTKIWLPWRGFNGRRAEGSQVADIHDGTDFQEMERLAKSATSADHWVNLRGGRALFTRNAFVVAKGCFDKPVDAVVCWQPRGKRYGGTAHAMRVASNIRPGMPIFNIRVMDRQRVLAELEELQRSGRIVDMLRDERNVGLTR